jgi:hypothetical protein
MIVEKEDALELETLQLFHDKPNDLSSTVIKVKVKLPLYLAGHALSVPGG